MLSSIKSAGQLHRINFGHHVCPHLLNFLPQQQLKLSQGSAVDGCQCSGSIQRLEIFLDLWCRSRTGRGAPAADPNLSPPRQHAAPDEHAPLLSNSLAQATEDDDTEVSTCRVTIDSS